MEIFIYVYLLGISGFILIKRAYLLAQKKEWVQLLGELYVPIFLFVCYGVAGFHIILSPSSSYVQFNGVAFEREDVLTAYVMMCPIMLSISMGFRQFYKGKNLHHSKHILPDKKIILRTRLLTFCLLAFDLTIRIISIKSGTYFSWMRTDIVNAGDFQIPAHYMIQQFLSPLLAVLICLQSNSIKLFKFILIFFLLLIFLEGKRLLLIQVIVSIILTQQSLTSISESKKIVLPIKSLIAWLIILNFSLNSILGIRAIYRAERSIFLNNPMLIIEKTITEYIPSTVYGLFNETDKEAQSLALEDASILNRYQHWQGSFSSQLNRLRNGWNYMPLTDMAENLMLPIPSLFLGNNKPVIEAGIVSSHHFSLDKNSKSKPDPATTVFSHIYQYTGIFGGLILGYIFGAFNGFIARLLLSRYQYIGKILFLGQISFLNVDANSFSVIFVNFRNQILILCIFYIALGIPKEVDRLNSKAQKYS